jgi:hypothetical protein
LVLVALELAGVAQGLELEVLALAWVVQGEASGVQELELGLRALG